MHYTDVMSAIDTELAARGGRATTKELADAIGVDTTQIRKCAGYLGHVTKAAGMYQPATVIDWHTLEPDELPDEDRWLLRMFEKTGATAIESARINKVATLAGYSKAAVARAYMRQGCASVMISGKWHRTAPGTGTETTEAAATLTDDDAVAMLASDEAPVVTDKRGEATEWIDSHRLQCRWICEFLSSDARDADEQGVPRDHPGCSPTMDELLESARYAKRPPTDDIRRAVAELVKVGRLAISDNQRIHATDAGMAWVGK